MALSPAEEMRRQLDALMGTTRNEGGSRAQRFTDPEICRSYCTGLCPHDLFTNTKKDMGACPKLHSLPMKQLYEQERKDKDYGFEKELARVLYDLIAECDRECERQNAKLKETEEEKLLEDPINRQLIELQSQADRLGEEGKIDEYLKVNSQMDLLKAKQKEQAQLPDVVSQLYNGRVPQVQKLKTCEICACYLSKFDNDQRLVEGHYLGKLHTGYKEIREKYAELKKGGFFEEPAARNYDDRRNTTVKRRDDNDYQRRDPYRDNGRDNRDNRNYNNRDNRDYGRDYRDDRRDNQGRDNRDNRDNRGRDSRDNRDRGRDRDRDDRDNRDKRRRSRSK
jgi:hypothetical protein